VFLRNSLLSCRFLPPFLFPVLYLVVLPFFLPLYYPFLILYLVPCLCSRVPRTTEWQISCPSISLHHESDRPSFIFIVHEFYGRRFLRRRHRTLMPRVRGIHLAPETSVIYNSQTPRLEACDSFFPASVDISKHLLIFFPIRLNS
jgi:hypothetical protein